MEQIQLDFHVRNAEWKIYRGMKFFVLEFEEIKVPIVFSRLLLEESNAKLPNIEPSDPVTLWYAKDLLVGFYHKNEKVFHMTQAEIENRRKFVESFGAGEREVLDGVAYEAHINLRTKA